MLLGFKRQFAPFVEEGSKSHTIRGERKSPPKVGDVAHCYVDPRQKTMRLLGRWPVVRVQEIEIDHLYAGQGAMPDRLMVRIDGIRLDWEETEALFYRDGFRSDSGTKFPATACALKFWAGRIPFVGDLIHWDYSKPVQL